MRPDWLPPFHLRDEACVKAPACLQQLGGLSIKEQLFIHQLHQNQSDQLAHVLPADQLLVATRDKQKRIKTYLSKEMWKAGYKRVSVRKGRETEEVPRPRDGDANVSAKVGEYRW